MTGTATDGSVIEIIRYELPASLVDSFREVYSQVSEQLKASQHCLGYEVIQGIEEPRRFIIIIKWDSVEGHEEAFTGGPLFAEFITPLRPYLDYVIEMRHYERTGIAWRG